MEADRAFTEDEITGWIAQFVDGVESVCGLNAPFHVPDHSGDNFVLKIGADDVGPNADAVFIFEQHLCEITGFKHAIAVSSGTAGLYLALMAAGVGRGDTVDMSNIGYAAAPNAVFALGASPRVSDTDKGSPYAKFIGDHPDTSDVMVDTTRPRRTAEWQQEGSLPANRFAICAHMGGAVVPSKYWHRWPHQFVIHDACQSLGAVDVKNLAAGRFGYATVISFAGNKIVTTGQGGAVLTDWDDVADDVRAFSDQGRMNDVDADRLNAIFGPGFNFRMSGVAAALGNLQLQDFPNLLKRQQSVLGRYVKATSPSVIVDILEPADGSLPNGWGVVAKFHSASVCARAAVELTLRGIEYKRLFTPLGLQHAAIPVRFKSGNADALCATTLALPSSPSLGVKHGRRKNS